MNKRSKTFTRSKSANSLHLTDEGNYKEALKIHGIDGGNNDSSADSDSGKSSLDEDYFKYRPGPIQVDTNKVINISSKTSTGAVTESFFNATKDISKIEVTKCLPAQSVNDNEKQRNEEREKPQEKTIVRTDTFNRTRTNSLPDGKEFATQGPKRNYKLEHISQTRVQNVLKLAKQKDKLPLLTSTAYEKTEDLPVLSTQIAAIHSETASRPAQSTSSSFVNRNTPQTECLPKLTTYIDNIVPLHSTASKYAYHSSSERNKGITTASSTNFKKENTFANLGFTSTEGLPKSTIFLPSKSETKAKTTIKNNYTKGRPSSSVDCKVAQTKNLPKVTEKNNISSIHNNAVSANISVNRPPGRFAKEASTSDIYNIENNISSYISTVKNTQKSRISIINCETSNTNVVQRTNQIKSPIRSNTSQHGFKSTNNQTRPSNQFIRPYASSDIREYGSRSSGNEAERRSPRSLAGRLWRSILGCICIRCR